MPNAFVNRIATAVPENDVHRFFLRFAQARLAFDPRRQALFSRMSDKGGIDHRYSFIVPSDDPEGPTVDVDGSFRLGSFPSTADRMRMFEAQAPELARMAVENLQLGQDRARITHLIVTSCTGFSAPGVDLELIARCGLSPRSNAP